MKSIDEIQSEIVEQYKGLGDWMDIYQALIRRGCETEILDINYKTDSNLIDGCQNKVWVVAENVDNKVVYHFDSEATIVRGIVSLILSAISNHTAEEILATDLYFVEEIGLKDQLSYNRGNGLRLIIERIYELAKQFA